MNTFPIILASASPRREKLIKQIGLKFTVKPSQVVEDFSLQLPPPQFARYYAEKKAAEIASLHPSALVIGADTIVVVDDDILGKPKNKTDSFNMLSKLSGRSHTVITGVALRWTNEKVIDTFHETTVVTFNTLSNNDISYYIDTYNPLDKAGSYGIQDWFSVCINKIEGCFYNVVGLPLSSLYQHLKKLDQFNR